MRFARVGAIVLGGTVAVFTTAAAEGQAVQVANFGAEFPTDPAGTPGTGWQYLWNPAGAPIGTRSGYVPLAWVPGSTRFETAGGSPNAYPDAAPGSSLYIDNDALYPGQAQSQAADGLEHYAIIAYTIQPDDVAAAGGGPVVTATLDTYSFDIGAGGDGINARLYIDDTPAPGRPFQPLPAPLLFSDATPVLGGPFPIGDVSAGQTIYIAIGASGPTFFATGGATPGNDTADTLGLSFTLALQPVPEPASFGALAAAGVAGLATRRRRRSHA